MRYQAVQSAKREDGENRLNAQPEGRRQMEAQKTRSCRNGEIYLTGVKGYDTIL